MFAIIGICMQDPHGVTAKCCHNQNLERTLAGDAKNHSSLGGLFVASLGMDGKSSRLLLDR